MLPNAGQRTSLSVAFPTSRPERRACGMRLLSRLAFMIVPLLFAASLEAQEPVLHVATANSQAEFRIGERIPLLLSFTGPAHQYELNTASYDRSGRLFID